MEEKKMMGGCVVCFGGGGFPDRFQAEGLPFPRYHRPPLSSGALFPHRAKCRMCVRSRVSLNIDQASLKKGRRNGRGIYIERQLKKERKGARVGVGVSL